MKTVVPSKGQVVVPAALRDNDSLVDWLLACPEKDWFQPIASESTDALRNPLWTPTS